MVERPTAPGPAGLHPLTTAGAPVHLLFTCTANRIRLPFAAAVAARHVADLGLAVVVRSAGQLESGAPVTEQIEQVGHRLGVDLSEHVSTQVSPELLEWSDLVVTMTGQHVVDLCGAVPECRDRTITLREWAHATVDQRPVPGWTPAEVRDWASVVSQRSISVLLSGSEDVADPIGLSRRQYRRTAEEIAELLAVCFLAEPPAA